MASNLYSVTQDALSVLQSKLSKVDRLFASLDQAVSFYSSRLIMITPITEWAKWQRSQTGPARKRNQVVQGANSEHQARCQVLSKEARSRTLRYGNTSSLSWPLLFCAETLTKLTEKTQDKEEKLARHQRKFNRANKGASPRRAAQGVSPSRAAQG